MKKEFIKVFAWGVGVGAVLLLIIIFTTGWVVTSGSAKTKAEKMVEEEILKRLVPICIEQFQKDPQKKEKLMELKNLNYWKRGEYVEKQGWATMPGMTDPERIVADACARSLVDLEL